MKPIASLLFKTIFKSEYLERERSLPGTRSRLCFELEEKFKIFPYELFICDRAIDNTVEYFYNEPNKNTSNS